MNHILTEMLARYQTESLTDRKNAVKEVMQEIVLCGLSRAGFFQKAAFYNRRKQKTRSGRSKHTAGILSKHTEKDNRQE